MRVAGGVVVGVVMQLKQGHQVKVAGDETINVDM